MHKSTAKSSPVHHLLKPRRARVKTGCLPCRLRRKKCDEAKPICSGCKRNHLICSQDLDIREGEKSPFQESQLDDPARFEDKTSEEPNHIEPKWAFPRIECQSKLGQEPTHRTTPVPLGQLDALNIFDSSNLGRPASRVLFEHYVHETADRLAINRGTGNPFVSCVIPVAHSDSMVMDSVLALSGAHLCSTTQGDDVVSTSSTHYILAVRQLKHELTHVASGEPPDLVRLLLTILLLSITESVSGNTQGATFYHLRASSHFIATLLAPGQNIVDQETCAFLLETYAYMVSIANITANAEPTFPAFVLDSCIIGLEKLQSCKANGMMFGYAQSLITLIPSICTLGYDRLVEQTSGTYSFESVASYRALLLKIESWQEPLHRPYSGKTETELISAAEAYRTAILIFLHAAFYATNVTTPEALTLIDELIHASFLSLSFDEDSPVLSVMLWPCMIIGSCLRDPFQRAYIRSKMLKAPFNMTIVLNSVQLLDWLWEDTDPNIYGPYGLGIVMKKHGVVHSMG